MAANPKDNEWLKDIDLARGIENTLVGVILFVGRYIRTFVVFLLRPAPIEVDLIFNPSYKNLAQIEYTRPVSFLVVSGFVYLGFTLPTAGALLPIEPLIREFQWLIDRLPHKLDDITLTKIATFMIPFVLFAAFYALITAKLFAAFRRPAVFKVHLNITAYAAGCFARGIIGLLPSRRPPNFLDPLQLARLVRDLRDESSLALRRINLKLCHGLVEGIQENVHVPASVGHDF